MINGGKRLNQLAPQLLIGPGHRAVSQRERVENE